MGVQAVTDDVEGGHLTDEPISCGARTDGDEVAELHLDGRERYQFDRHCGFPFPSATRSHIVAVSVATGPMARRLVGSRRTARRPQRCCHSRREWVETGLRAAASACRSLSRTVRCSGVSVRRELRVEVGCEGLFGEYGCLLGIEV